MKWIGMTDDAIHVKEDSSVCIHATKLTIDALKICKFAEFTVSCNPKLNL